MRLDMRVTLDFVEVQHLFFSVLRAQGNPVSLDVMPGSIRESLSDAGWKVFLAAFPKAAGQGRGAALLDPTASPLTRPAADTDRMAVAGLMG